MRFNLPAVHVKSILITIASIAALVCVIPFLLSYLSDDHIKDSADSEPNPSFETVQIPKNITIYRSESNQIDTVDFEDYIKGVVSSEMPSSFHKEALKAQAVAARTYSAARILNAEESGNPKTHPKAPLCDTTHCQVYRSEKELRNIKGSTWMKDDYPKICSAVNETKSELLYYDGKLVQQALFHSSSGGKTENSEDVFAAAVPYLISVESPYEKEATHQNEKTSLSIDEFASKVRSAYPSTDFGSITSDNIEIISRSDGNRVDKMQAGSAVLTGRQVREALGLSSANFKIDIKDNTITFTSNGSGHGVGMSQYGADGMAKEGYDYKKILSHYYSGTEVH